MSDKQCRQEVLEKLDEIIRLLKDMRATEKVYHYVASSDDIPDRWPHEWSRPISTRWHFPTGTAVNE